MRRPTLPALTAAATACCSPSEESGHGLPTSTAATSARPTGTARDFSRVDRNTAWKLADKLHLDFPTFHTEGLAVTPDHLFLSAVEIIEPTQKYPSPVGGYDRTPGKGVGHLFVMDRQGHLQKDIVLGEGDRYHPGGIDFDGTNVWVPVAEYRPDSAAIIYRVDAHDAGGAPAVRRRRPHRRHRARQDHGATGRQHLGLAKFYEWRPDGRQVDGWDNPQLLRRLPGLPVRPRREDDLRRRHEPARRPRRPVVPRRRTSSAGWR